MEFPTNISMSINDHLPSSNDLHSRSRVFSGIIMRYVPGREGEREGLVGREVTNFRSAMECI